MGVKPPGVVVFIDTYTATVVFDPRRLKQTSTWRNLREDIYPPQVPDAEVFDVLLELIARGPV